MSGILDRAKAHYDSLDPVRIEVPEWGGPEKPLVITTTALTVAERRKIYRPDDKGTPPDGGAVQVRALIEKACDESGKKLFDAMAEHDLTYKVDSAVVGRIATIILFGQAKAAIEQVDDAKNG